MKTKKKGLYPDSVLLCAQTFCPSYKGRAMQQFCVLFCANYTILATQRRGPLHYATPLNTPLKGWQIFHYFLRAKAFKILHFVKFFHDYSKIVVSKNNGGHLKVHTLAAMFITFRNGIVIWKQVRP